MPYLPFRELLKLNIPARRVKWAKVLFSVGCVFLILEILGIFLPSRLWMNFVGSVGAKISLMGMMLVLVPEILLPLGLIFAPFIFAFYYEWHDQHIWKTWWFWAAAIPCEAVAVASCLWLDKRYRK